MSDDSELCPSGPWHGFYLYAGSAVRHRMELDLVFANGRIAGDGHDGVGSFRIVGRYGEAARDVTWTKSYIGRHTVHYSGFREGPGIWGSWTIAGSGSGGFKIWPRRHAENLETATEEAVEALVPVRVRK